MDDIVLSKVKDYVLDYIGERESVGVPVFDISKKLWRVPILCRLPKGQLPVGEFVLDERANFVSIPDRESMIRIAEAYNQRLPFLVYGEEEELNRKGIEHVSV